MLTPRGKAFLTGYALCALSTAGMRVAGVPEWGQLVSVTVAPLLAYWLLSRWAAAVTACPCGEADCGCGRPG